MIEFQECAACAAKPGAPTLCAACLHNRTTINRLCAQVESTRHPLTKEEVRAALHAGHVERMVATWTSLVRQRGRALADTDTAITIGGEFVAARDRLRAALDHLRKNIDGYDAIFEIAQEIAAGKIIPPQPSAAVHAPITTVDQWPHIIGCSCGWKMPPGATDADDESTRHAALEEAAR
jgi:hypothetical protein